MTADEMIEEMRRKPDAHLLLEWIYEQNLDGTLAAPIATLTNVIGAYFEAES